MMENKATVSTTRNKYNPLIAAIMKGNSRIVKILLKHKFSATSFDNTSETPLHISCNKDHLSVVKLLLSNNAAIDQPNDNNETPLLIASTKGNARVLKLLIESKAKLDFSQEERNPLDTAIQHGHYNVVEVLISQIPDINSLYINNNSILSLACSVGHLKIVTLLLDHKANIENGNIEDKTTPLMIAVKNDHGPVVELLLQNNASILALNNKEENVLEIAQNMKNSQQISLLHEYYKPQNWTKDEVSLFLRSNQQFKHLATTFIKEEIDGPALLKLNNTDLKELGLDEKQQEEFKNLINPFLKLKLTVTDTWPIPQLLLEDPNWVRKGGNLTPFQCLKIMEDGKPIHPSGYEFMNSFVGCLKSKKEDFKNVHLIYNEQLSLAVKFFKSSHEERFSQTTQPPWKKSSNVKEREIVKSYVDALIQKCPWNTGGVPIIPMAHGTDPKTAWKIAETGFASICKLDEGWYGRGIYLTSDLHYCLDYGDFIIVGLVVTGQIYPVTTADSLSGKSALPGYQSNYVVVQNGGDCVNPTKEGMTSYEDELIVFNDTQVLPLFIIELSNTSLGSGSDESTEEGS
uniref:SAM domain-containing protein n=1 Tax=Arcella intermedia TaxID=1963864 RepID=A0A6B2L0H9_9EUKA